MSAKQQKRRGHGDGGIDARGPDRWRLRYRIDGKRYSKTVHGTRKEAQTELRKLLRAGDDGTHVAPDRQTVAEYLRSWLDTEPVIGAQGKILAPKTLERYRQLRDEQTIPHLGDVALQKLKPKQISDWHSTLLQGGLHPRTVGHAHRMLGRGLQRAVELEILVRNVTSAVKPPRFDDEEVEILTDEQVTETLTRLEGHRLHSIAVFALASGCRRGEICGLTWGAVDRDKGTVEIRQSIEETATGLRSKPPKSKAGRRSITLPLHAIEMLRIQYRQAMKVRLQLGLGGRPSADDWVFPDNLDGSQPYPPDKLSRDWGNVVRDRKLPKVMFHALRHTHVSALIAAGQDIVSVSKRIGHSSPAITLKVYSHVFTNKSDAAAAEAIDQIFQK